MLFIFLKFFLVFGETQLRIDNFIMRMKKEDRNCKKGYLTICSDSIMVKPGELSDIIRFTEDSCMEGKSNDFLNNFKQWNMLLIISRLKENNINYETFFKNSMYAINILNSKLWNEHGTTVGINNGRKQVARTRILPTEKKHSIKLEV